MRSPNWQPDKKNSVLVERQMLRDVIANIFIDRTSGLFWDDETLVPSETLGQARQQLEVHDAH